MSVRLNIHEAKTHLSKYLARLKPGDTIVLCKRNVPVAEIRPLPRASGKRRPWGIDKGLFVVPDNFNDPLPEEELRLWEGDSEDSP